MTTILLCNADTLAIPSALFLQSKGMLAAVVIPGRSAHVLLPVLQQAGIPAHKTHVVTKKNLVSVLKELTIETGAAVITALTFPWLLPDEILSCPAHGCLNFHFGLLPKYKGADPVFWQLRNGEKEGGITIHKMTGDIDSGPVLFINTLPFMPGETYGIHCERLGHLAAAMMQQLPARLAERPLSDTVAENSDALFFKAPDIPARTIQWNQSALDIQQLINACNPKYGGADTTFRNTPVRVLEVLPVEVNNPQENVLPGTIVHADLIYGLIVSASDRQYLRITIAQVREGYLSGSKLAQLGWQPGERFI
ncbi:methionyl-tRNA formyltransferase [Filimonas zeae]|uniref:Methionyl-tRNA formyltransferase n=1 Tax=Filimonas zeae TaxID=1737353 RepID=A0A917MX12_9BACT|nr:formyltransferase family protein [Filimonas zeae]MDR6340301.1 methionyl-tRNA formyltransferase [Filimonas zeae]GGH72087.1 hypothetical protein GCM10011379_32140 [Filimonas zeae]